MSTRPIKYTMCQMARMIKVPKNSMYGETHMIYADTDSVKVSKDTTPCMYDYAKEILKGVENEKK